MDDLDDKARELSAHVHAVVLQQRALEALAAADPELPLNRQELLAIGLLGDGGASIMRSLAERLYLAVNSITALVDNLEKRSLVRRERDQSDRRLVWVHLTSEGERIYQAIVDERLRLCRSLLGALTEDEQEIYLVLMRKIARAARAFVAESPSDEDGNADRGLVGVSKTNSSTRVRRG